MHTQRTQAQKTQTIYTVYWIRRSMIVDCRVCDEMHTEKYSVDWWFGLTLASVHHSIDDTCFQLTIFLVFFFFVFLFSSLLFFELNNYRKNWHEYQAYNKRFDFQFILSTKPFMTPLCVPYSLSIFVLFPFLFLSSLFRNTTTFWEKNCNRAKKWTCFLIQQTNF